MVLDELFQIIATKEDMALETLHTIASLLEHTSELDALHNTVISFRHPILVGYVNTVFDAREVCVFVNV